MSGGVDEDTVVLSDFHCQECGVLTLGFELNGKTLCKQCFIKGKLRKK